MNDEYEDVHYLSDDLSEASIKTQKMHKRLDIFRKALIGIILVGVLFILVNAEVHWGWWIAWLTIGFVVVLNVVGFLTLPLYGMFGGSLVSARLAEIEKRMEERMKEEQN